MDTTIEEEIARIRIPRQGEVLAIATTMLGAGKIMVECDDGFTRIGRVAGRIKKKVWIRLGDLVLVEPWKVQTNERGDIVWKYRRNQAAWLKRKGYIKNLNIE
jgi:translation initiation factor 1A